MYRYMLLCLLFAQVQAADDGKLIDARTQQLELVRQESQWDNEHRFVYEQEYNGSEVNDSLPEGWESRWCKLPLVGIRAVMQNHNALSEVNYFRNLGASILNDKKKLSKKRVLTPFFDQLAHKRQEEKDAVLRQFLKTMNDSDYPLGRLVCAASLYAGASVNVLKGDTREVLSRALSMNDPSLIRLALQCGADPNHCVHKGGKPSFYRCRSKGCKINPDSCQCWQKEGDSILSLCRSVQAAELMVKHGAKIAEARYQGNDLIGSACADSEFLLFYLNYMPLEKENELGFKWIKGILREMSCFVIEDMSDLVRRVEILLERGCQYNEAIKERFCAYVAKKSPELRERIDRAFTCADEKNKVSKMIQRLEVTGQEGQWDGEGRFVYEGGSQKLSFYPIKEFMIEVGALREFDYFKRLGASKLDDEQKISKQMVLTTYFNSLAGQRQEVKDEALRRLLSHKKSEGHPLSRLLFAAFLHAGANPKVLEDDDEDDLLCQALERDDLSLVDLALKNGADPNSSERERSILYSCQSKEAVEILLEHGFQCDEETKNQVAQKSPELKELIEKAFADAEIKKNIKGE